MASPPPLPPTPPLTPEGFAASTWQRWLDILRRRLAEAYSPSNPPPQELTVPATHAAVATLRTSLKQLELAVTASSGSEGMLAAIRKLAAFLGKDANFAELELSGNLQFENAGGSYYSGVENGAGSLFGATPYAAVIDIPASRSLQFLIGGTTYFSLSASGYVLTGDAAVSGGFGCNGQPAQPPVASGGAVTTTPATNAAPYGFATAAQADAIIARLNTIQAALVANGTLS